MSELLLYQTNMIEKILKFDEFIINEYIDININPNYIEITNASINYNNLIYKNVLIYINLIKSNIYIYL